MSFLAGGSGNADCGPVNPMAGLMKQFQQDRSLQQDRFASEQRGESSKTSFRTRPVMNGPERQLTNDFFREEMERAGPKPFEMNGLSRELERIQHHRPEPSNAVTTNEWSQDFMLHQHPPQQTFGDFEQVFHNSQPHQQQLQQQQQQQQPIHGSTWNGGGLNTFQNRLPLTGTLPLNQTHGASAFDSVFEEAKGSQINWEQEFAAAQQNDWTIGFQQEEEQQQQQQEKKLVASNDDDALAKTAAMLLDSVDIESNPKFKNSQFMNLMRRLRDSEVKVEGDKMVETKSSTGWASEFENSTATTQNNKDWTGDFLQHAGSSSSGNMWSTDFAQRAERGGWTNEFNYEQNQHQQPGDWASEFSKTTGINTSNTHQTQELFGKTNEMEDWVQQYNKNMKHINEAKNHTWENDGDWESSSAQQQPLSFRATDPAYDSYYFTLNNPYILNPHAIDGEQHTSLSDSILALEAKAQLKMSDANAWKMLGQRQQENERDVAAIAALRQAMKINPGLLDGWITLAVSYTNENCKDDAFDALEQWVANHPDYKHLLQQSTGRPEQRHNYLIDVFLEAARFSPGAEMDPEVQIGLGILFNVSADYSKAIDCFKAALNSKPQDYLLWNKLGATLANSGNSEGAVDAYFNALVINPAYVRARYNVAISCINMEQHQEAAEHLLTALSLQQANDRGENSVLIDETESAVNMPGGMNDSIWGTLRMLMRSMNREDLANQCDKRNLNSFRAEFNF